jgi:hypothetical protein
MAFYSILFAILFLGAFRELIRSFGVSDWPGVWMAATLTMVIFNDVLYTSHFMEEEHCGYTIPMKVADVLSFVMLSIAVLALQPSEHNVFEADPGAWVRSLPRAPVFWGVLVLYWVTTIAWNLFGRFYSGQHVNIHIHWAMLGCLSAIFVLSLLAIPWADVIGSCVLFVLFSFYTCVLKPLIFAKKKVPSGEVKTT